MLVKGATGTSEMADGNVIIDGQIGQMAQVAFDFPSADMNHDMSVEVVMKFVYGCTSSVLTWWECNGNVCTYMATCANWIY